MSPSERDHHARKDSPAEATPDALEHVGSNADSDDSAAHIAELVRRTAEHIAAPRPSSVATPDVTVAQRTSGPAASVGQQASKPIGSPPAPPAASVGQQASKPIGSPPAPPASSKARPSRRVLVVAGVIIAVQLVGGLALSGMFGSEAPKAPTPTVQSSAPAGYVVKVSDVITDCAKHARGRVKISFGTLHCVKATRSLATGQISGRPALFVVSRIQMASAEAAASVKQVLDGSGTGNLNDLLREGKTFPSAPNKMPVSGYTSVQTGAVVTVVEAGFIDGGPSSSTNAALRASAAQVASIVSAQK